MKTCYDLASVYGEGVEYQEGHYEQVEELKDRFYSLFVVQAYPDSENENVKYSAADLTDEFVKTKIEEVYQYAGYNQDDDCDFAELFNKLVEVVKNDSSLVMVEYSVEADMSFLVMDNSDYDKVMQMVFE
jgi:hypothetical protein